MFLLVYHGVPALLFVAAFFVRRNLRRRRKLLLAGIAAESLIICLSPLYLLLYVIWMLIVIAYTLRFWRLTPSVASGRRETLIFRLLAFAGIVMGGDFWAWILMHSL